MKEHVSKLIEAISKGLLEREETVALAFLAVLSGQSVFLYGPPGTAKSLIARRISLAFKDAKFFEYLMNRFSTPEEVFGPVSIKELKEDRFIRKPKGYLPEADVAFLDEIWKSSPAILNTLLTIINERKFRNGDKVEDVPLKGVVAASNEIPPPNQGLEALYDRFVMRLVVNPMSDRCNFESLLKGRPTSTVIEVDESLKFDSATWAAALELLESVGFSSESLEIINSIRVKIDEFNKNVDANAKIYISDRRWQKMAQVMKMAAYLCDRDEVRPVDVLILKNCLWTKPENREPLAKIVEESVRGFCVYNSDKFYEWQDKFKKVTSEINSVLFYESAEYDFEIKEINGENCLKIPVTVPFGYKYSRVVKEEMKLLFIPISNIEKTGKFNPISANGEPVSDIAPSDPEHFNATKIECKFSEKRFLTISYTITNEEDYYRRTTQVPSEKSIEVKCLHEKGERKSVIPRVKKMYVAEIANLIESFQKIFMETRTTCEKVLSENTTPFVSSKDQSIVASSIQDFIDKTMRTEWVALEHLRDQVERHQNP